MPMITIQLEQQMWNSIIALLAEVPYKVSAPLINSIVEQAQQQTNPPPQRPQMPQPNGADSAVEVYRTPHQNL